jgi:hypothetical protein
MERGAPGTGPHVAEDSRGRVALGWGCLCWALVANVGPGSKGYMERAYSTALGLDRPALCTAWNWHVDDGGTHGAEDLADFSSHDGDDCWEQLRGRADQRLSIFARADATATRVNAGCCCGQYQQRAIGRPATAPLYSTHSTACDTRHVLCTMPPGQGSQSRPSTSCSWLSRCRCAQQPMTQPWPRPPSLLPRRSSLLHARTCATSRSRRDEPASSTTDQRLQPGALLFSLPVACRSQSATEQFHSTFTLFRLLLSPASNHYCMYFGHAALRIFRLQLHAFASVNPTIITGGLRGGASPS